MVAGWGVKDFVGKKSREQGASWIMAALFVWSFVFLHDCHVGFGSKDETTADDAHDPGSFGWKIDFLLSRLPTWMVEWYDPKKHRNQTKHTWRRPDCNNYIKGFSATAGIARGGRYKVFFLDEAAFFPAGMDYEAFHNLERVTNCTVVWSTPNGLNNAFCEKVHEENNWTLLVLDFLDNPIHGKGRYTTTAGKLQVLDGEVVPDYPYELDGRERSFWLDQQWLRSGKNLIFLDQELYMDFGGSKGRPFPAVILERARIMCRPPLETGMLLYNEVDPWDQKALQWIKNDNYKFDLWRPVDQYGRLHVSRPMMGADIGHGNSGDQSSNSVLSIWDGATGEQVGELAVNHIPPNEFARLSVAVCLWLSPIGDTFFIWEKNGSQGTTFTDEMMLLRYPNVYYASTGGDEQRHYVEKTDKPGYHNSNLANTLTPFLTELSRNEITVRSASLLAEAAEYEIDGKRWVHPRSVNSRDASALGENHGDRVVAAAMAMRAMRERPHKPEDSIPPVIRQQSIEGRMARDKARSRSRGLRVCRF